MITILFLILVLIFISEMFEYACTLETGTSKYTVPTLFRVINTFILGWKPYHVGSTHYVSVFYQPLLNFLAFLIFCLMFNAIYFTKHAKKHLLQLHVTCFCFLTHYDFGSSSHDSWQSLSKLSLISMSKGPFRKRVFHCIYWNIYAKSSLTRVLLTFQHNR